MLPKCILHLSISLHLHCWHIKLNASLWWPPATVSYSYSCFPSIYFSQGSQNNLKNNKSDRSISVCVDIVLCHITCNNIFSSNYSTSHIVLLLSYTPHSYTLWTPQYHVTRFDFKSYLVFKEIKRRKFYPLLLSPIYHF